LLTPKHVYEEQYKLKRESKVERREKEKVA
jgi:hypothetical protein